MNTFSIYRSTFVITFIFFALFQTNGISQANLRSSNYLKLAVDDMVADMQPRIIEWRHHFHQNPELSNREFKTAAYIEAHLKSLGLEVRNQVAHTGIVAVLKGGKPGPVVALRADMDALPLKKMQTCHTPVK